MMKTAKFNIAFALCLLVHFSLKAQDWKDDEVDDLFTSARTEAYNGKWQNAVGKLKFILQKYPGYNDVRIFLGRMYSWKGHYEAARKELEVVLQNTPANMEARQALIDVELWNNNYDQVLLLASSALATQPNDTFLLYKQAVALNSLGKFEEALNPVKKLLIIAPTHRQGTELFKSLRLKSLKFTTGIGYGIDLFSRTFAPAQYLSVHIGRINAWGSSIARFNYTRRFNTTGIQCEVDLYPKIANGVYAYLSYGYSESSLFPDHRAAAEIFSKFLRSLEASAGIRYLGFDRHTKIMVYTSSVGWYFKNYWFSFRSFIIPDPETGASTSAAFFARKYFHDAENYIGISVGMGFSPDFKRIQSGAGLSDNEIYVLKSQRAGITLQKAIALKWILTAALDFSRQELAFDQGKYVIIHSVNTGIQKKF